MGLIVLEKLRLQDQILTSYTRARLVLCSWFPVRTLLVTALFALVTGCFGSSGVADFGNDKDPTVGGGGGFGPGRCGSAADCVLAAATCCECPTFASSIDDPTVQACTDVGCPANNTCADNVHADCSSDGVCVLVCAPTQCSTDCAAGYATDPSGCLTCACAMPASDGCTKDADCVETRADCCGCHVGGIDTAVLGRDVMRFDAMLGCPADAACPGVDTCIAGDAPRCVQGQCELLPEGLPPNACGRPDLAACGAGTVCTVNASDPANLYGVGVCVPP